LPHRQRAGGCRGREHDRGLGRQPAQRQRATACDERRPDREQSGGRADRESDGHHPQNLEHHQPPNPREGEADRPHHRERSPPLEHALRRNCRHAGCAQQEPQAAEGLKGRQKDVLHRKEAPQPVGRPLQRRALLDPGCPHRVGHGSRLIGALDHRQRVAAAAWKDSLEVFFRDEQLSLQDAGLEQAHDLQLHRIAGVVIDSEARPDTAQTQRPGCGRLVEHDGNRSGLRSVVGRRHGARLEQPPRIRLARRQRPVVGE